MALGLPIKMVVLTIVGMIGLAVMLAFIGNSENAIPRPMHATLTNNSLVILSKFNDSIELNVEVINSNDGTPVEKASVFLSGLDTAEISTTDKNGDTVLRFNKDDFHFDTNEGYLKLDVKAAGYRDYTNEYAVKIVK